MSQDTQTIRRTVREKYGQIAETGASCCSSAGTTSGGGGGCCTTVKQNITADDLAERIGYSAGEIRNLPEGANMGLSCGNPTAIANLKPGQVVLDLGCGGGFDVFLAGPKVGSTGRVIGVDMTPQMLDRARGNVAAYRKATGLNNVEFRLGEIEHLPVADASVDVVISNCVINLSSDKPRVWREIVRVLKPGGTVAVSDMALKRELPAAVRGMVEALVGCIAGAVLIDEYRQTVESAGLTDVRIAEKPGYVCTLEDSDDPLYRDIVSKLPAGASAADYIVSIDVTARR